MIRLFLIFLFFAAPSLAATVTVKAAEHDGFTRVVFYVPKNQPYTIDYVKGGVQIAFETSLNLKSETLFSRLYAGRVRSVGLDEARKTLTLTVGCDCDVLTFRDQNDLAVFDIKPVSTDRLLEPLITSENKHTPNPHPTVSNTKPLFSLPLFLPELDIKPAAKNLETTRSNLETALTKAANRKLLNIDVSNENFGKPKTDPGPISEPSPTVADDILNSIETNFDRGLTAQGDKCLENSQFEIATWRTHENFFDDLASARKRLFTELGDPNPQAAADLTKIYISYGLADEARHIFNHFNVATTADAPLLNAMIHALQQSDDEHRYFANSLTCDSYAALWGVLETDPLPPSAELDGNALQLAFNSLPRELMEFVGPILIDRLVRSDFDETAHLISLQLKRREKDQSVESQFAHAKVLAATGDDADAIKELETLSEDFSNISPQALIDLVDLKASQNQAVSPKLALVAEALAWQERGTPQSDALNAADALAHLLSANFDISLAKFNALTKRTPEFIDQYVGLAAQNLDDRLFAEFVLGTPTMDNTILSQSTSLDVAHRLITLGFYDRAKDFLVEHPIGTTKDSQALALAKIDLAEFRPNQAISLLDGLDSDVANSVRLKAVIAAENWQRAAETIKYSDIDSMTAAIALETGFIDVLPETRTFLQPLFSFPSEPIPAIKDTEKPLKNASFTIEKSERLRKDILSVLENLNSF